MFWRSLLAGFACSFVLLFSSCDNGDEPESIAEKPGEIAGLGEAGGQPQGTPFRLPARVRLDGKLEGVNPNGVPFQVCQSDGSGEYVAVKFTLRNDSVSNGPAMVEFPAGLVIISRVETYQHGVLLEKVVVPVPPKVNGNDGVCEVVLLLACGNSDRSSTDEGVEYAFGPVTDSPLIKDLIRRLSSKKILLSSYPATSAGLEAFFMASEIAQAALWALTDGDGLDAEILSWIAEIPDK